MTSPLAHSFHEFKTFYIRERAAWIAENLQRDTWAPRSPRRLFNLAIKTLYRPYRRRLSAPAVTKAPAAALPRHSDHRWPRQPAA